MKDIIDLRFAVIQYPPNNKLIDGIKTAIRHSNEYHPQPTNLIKILAKKFNVSPDMILLTAGADEAIHLLGRIYSQNIVCFTPTYVEYGNKVVFQVKKLTKINSLVNSTYKVPIKKYKTSSLLFIANPNNPFGYSKKEDLLKLLLLNPDSYIVVDEAYGGFAPELTLTKDIKNNKNLIILKSFSKDYGLAGIRLGFVIAQPEVVKKLQMIVQVANVSYPSVVIAENALKFEKYSNKIISMIAMDRSNLANSLKKIGWHIFESKTNIMTVRFRSVSEAKKLTNYLKRVGIRISLGNGKANIGLDDTFVRLVVGTTKQNKTLINAINKFNT